MALYDFRIYDYHERQSVEDNNVQFTPFGDFGTFYLAIETAEIVITSFRSYVLFDKQDLPIECTKVYLSDGSFVFATNKYDTFKKNYLENYVPLFDTKHDDDDDLKEIEII